MNPSTMVASLVTLLSLLQLTTPLPLPSPSSTPTAAKFTDRNTDYIKKSCTATLYRNLCYDSLSVYATKIDSNSKQLVNTALNVTLTAAKSTSGMMKRLARIHNLKHREAAALADCIEVVADSVAEIRDSVGEMIRIRRSNFELTISDVQTWVSAALTDDDTCMEGFEGEETKGNVKILARRFIVRVAHLTSNALALINSFADEHNT